MAKVKFGSIYLRKKRQADGSVIKLPTWWIKYHKAGQVFRESTHSTDDAEAERQLQARLGEIATGKFSGLRQERVTFRELTEDLVEDYQQNRRPSLVQLHSRLKVHLLPAFAKVRAADFGTVHVKRYVRARLESGALNSTVNRELEIVRRVFRLAAECDPPKVARVPRLPRLEENNIRTGFLDYDGYVRLRDELPEHLRLLFVVGYHTGARLGELLQVRWDQVDFGAAQIILNPGTTKNKDGRVLPLYGDMREWLKMAQEIRDQKYPDCPYVFHCEGQAIGEFRKSWKSACKRAELGGLLFHDLRRTAVRNMVRAGVSEKIAMRISGHKTRSMFDRYDIVNDRDLTEAAAKMDTFLSAKATTATTDAATVPAWSDAAAPAGRVN